MNSTLENELSLRLLLPTLGLFIVSILGCGGGSGGGQNGSVPAAVTSVVVACSPGSISGGQISACSAVVAGTGNFSSSVSWSVAPSNSGTISGSGVFTPASGLGLNVAVTITATSSQTSTVSGSAKVQVNPPGVTVSLSPSSATLILNAAAQKINVLVTAVNGFQGSVLLGVKNLPPGTIASPISFTVTPGTPSSFTIAATGAANTGNNSCTVEADAGTQIVNTSLPLTINAGSIPDPFSAVGGTLTNGFWDEKRQLLYASNPGLGEVDVISPKDLKVLNRVSVPMPWGIDQMTDGHTLVLGSRFQGFYTLDQDTLAVNWHPAPNTSVYMSDLVYHTPVAMANGKVLLIAEEFGIESNNIVDGGQQIIEWDSKTGAFSNLLPTNPTTLSHGYFHQLPRSADHKWALMDSPYLYSSDSDSITQVPISLPSDAIVTNYAINSDGSEIAAFASPLSGGTFAYFFDHSGKSLGSIPIESPGTARAEFSPDGTRVYLSYADGYSDQIEVLDVANLKDLGFTPAKIQPADPDARFLAMDSGGRAYFGILGGVRIAETAGTQVPASDGGFQCVEPWPNDFPLNSTGLAQSGLSPVPPGYEIYINGEPASLTSNGDINIPASSIAGPRDVECVDALGNTEVRPFDLTYGVEPIAASATLLPPIGNPTIKVYGFGMFDRTKFISPTVNVGGASAVKVQLLSDPGGSNLQALWVQVPNGVPGQSADITVTSSNGTGTLPNAVTYIPFAKILPFAGIMQITFDVHRNLLYALTTNGSLYAFNPVSLDWQALPLPSFTSALRLLAMALSPDGTRMIIMGAGYNALVLDPDHSAQAVLVSTSGSNSLNYGGSVAITKSNLAVGPGFSVDLNSLSVSHPQLWSTYNSATLVRGSADGSRIYGAVTGSSGGTVFAFDASSLAGQGPALANQLIDGFWVDIAVSPDGNHLAALSPAGNDSTPGIPNPLFIFDSSLVYSSGTMYPALSTPGYGVNWGTQYGPQGKVIVVPSGDSIEFWDAAKGILLARLMAPEGLGGINTPAYAPNGWNVPQMALDAAGQTIFAVSASGLTMMKLAAPVDEMTATQWPPQRTAGRGQSAVGGEHLRNVTEVQHSPAR